MMNNHYALTRRALVATGVAIGLGLSQGALGDTATDDLEITAGLTEALTLSCDTALSFGITRLGQLDRGGATTITVDASDGSLTVGNSNNTGVTAGQGQAGSCTMSGSSAVKNAELSIDGDTNLGNVSVNLNGAENVSGLDEPTAALNDIAVSSFALDSTKLKFDANGQTTVGIGAELTIPNNLVADNFGGYGATITVTVDDNP